jgi:hypothetical protein
LVAPGGHDAASGQDVGRLTSRQRGTCPHRNPASRSCSGTPVTILNTIQVPNPATTAATTGEKIAGNTIELMTPSHFTPLIPKAAARPGSRPGVPRVLASAPRGTVMMDERSEEH